MWVWVTQCWLECYLYVIYRIFLLTVATEEEWIKVLKRKKSIKKKKENMTEEPFSGYIKCCSNDHGEKPQISVLATEIPCKKPNKTNTKIRIFFLLFWTTFVSEFLYCITRADSLGRSRLFTDASSPQSKLLLVRPLRSWVLTQFICWNRQYLAGNSSEKVQRIKSGFLWPCQAIKVSGKVYSNHPFLHSVLSLIEKSCSLCISESPFNKPL